MKLRIFLVLLAVSAARAETLERLAWEDCVRQAQDGNPTLAAAREALDRARYDLKAEKAAYFPSLSGSAGYTRSDRDDAEDPSDSATAGLSAQQTLFTGFGNRARVRRAEARLNAAEADAAQTGADVSSDLRRAFVRLLYAQEQIALAESIAERQRQNYELVQLRFDVGKEHKGSLLRSEATEKESAYDVEQARRALQVNRRELATALGRDTTDTLVAYGRLAADPPPEEPLLKDLARATPRYRRALASLESTRAAVTIARSPFYPELTARAAASRTGEDWPPDQDQWSAGISLSVPLFEGRRNVNALAGAQADLRQAEAALREEEQALALALESAWTDAQDALQRVEVQAAFLAAAEARAEIGRSQYANGLLSFDNWTQIEDELISARKSKLASDRDAALAIAAWDLARGVSLFHTP